MAPRIPTAEARKKFAKVIQRSAGGERIKLTRYNRTLAVLIPKADLDTLEDCESEGDTEAPRKQSRRR
jgi:prevent-host-death family protein